MAAEHITLNIVRDVEPCGCYHFDSIAAAKRNYASWCKDLSEKPEAYINSRSGDTMATVWTRAADVKRWTYNPNLG